MAQGHASTSPAESSARIAVLMPLPLDGAYDYAAPAGLAVAPGDFVTVPLGKRTVTGVAWGPGGNDIPVEKLKDVIAVLDLPPLAAGLMRTIDWTAAYTLTPPGAVLRMAMSVPSVFEPARMSTAYLRAESPETEPTAESKPDSRIRLTPARQRVLDALADGTPRIAAELARMAKVSSGVVRSMADAGLLRSVALQPRTDWPPPDYHRRGPVLSPAQETAAETLAEAVRGAAKMKRDADPTVGFSVTLLDGVTGSGKTEVYFEAIAATLAAGRQALVLLPEIALTAQWLKRFEDRFGAPPLEWHSDLSGAERRHFWRAVIQGNAKVVVAARSGLFLPFPDLGLIVVDEEHDASFKQEDGVIYNARDIAVVRARMGGFPVVLSSATPSLETVANVEAGRYGRIELPERHAGARLPRIEAIDMRAEAMGRQSWISPTLRAALAESLEAGEQSMLFLNRRGYAPLTLCRACGHRLECPQCTAWLVEHRLEGRLACHHCGFTMKPPPLCPSCGAAESLAACGPGVERVAEEASTLFPQARIDIMASDTMQSPAAGAELMQRMQARQIDILIGTQVMAKGHHFPMLTLVGVIDADLGLAGGDLRASERTYQLLHQVSGRAGRAEHEGRVLLQSYMPDHPVMKALVSGERDRFLAAEAEARRARHLPPFGRLAALIVSGPDASAVDAAARALGRTRPEAPGVEVLGPAPAPLSLLRGRHRHRLLLKARRDVNVQKTLRDWLARVRVPASVRVAVDVDPYSFV